MADYRSKLYNSGSMQMEGPSLPRCYSASCSTYRPQKGKTSGGPRSFNDAEFQRKKRVATYKVYSVEAKVKGSFKKSLRWIKDKYTQVVHGCW